MAKAGFKCNRCKRSFSMAAHLARHTSTIHGTKRKAAAGRPKGKKKVKRAVGRPKAVTPRVGGLGSGNATRLLGEMRRYHSDLAGRRAVLDAEISGLEGAMDLLGGVAPKASTRKTRGPGRPAGKRAGRKPVRKPSRKPARKPGRPAGAGARAGSLKDSIVTFLRQNPKPMSPRQIAVGVQKGGYKTKAKDLTKAISNALPETKGVKKIGRGMYGA